MEYYVDEKKEMAIAREIAVKEHREEEIQSIYEDRIRKRITEEISKKELFLYDGLKLTDVFDDPDYIQDYFNQRYPFYESFPLEFLPNVNEWLTDQPFSDITVDGFSLKQEYDRYKDRLNNKLMINLVVESFQRLSLYNEKNKNYSNMKGFIESYLV